MEEKPFFPSPALPEDDGRRLGTLELAYIGDSVFDVYVRGCLTLKGIRAGDMHHRAVASVNAHAQAETLEMLLPLLTPAEEAVVRRGRNTHVHHAAPKGVSHQEYASATALEALIGYLFLTGQAERLNELLSHITI